MGLGASWPGTVFVPSHERCRKVSLYIRIDFNRVGSIAQ